MEQLNAESALLSRQIESMRRRLKGLEGMNATKSMEGGGDMDQLKLKLDEVYEQVYPSPS